MSLKDCSSVRGRQVNFPRMHMELDAEGVMIERRKR